EKIVESWIPAGLRMARKVALGRGQTLRGKLGSDRPHADFRIDQNVRHIGQNRLAPTICRQRTLHETATQGLRLGCPSVPGLPCVVTEDPESLAVEFAQPAPNV